MVAETRAAGYGGVSAVAWATRIAHSTVNRGSNDLEAFDAARKVWRADGGRSLLTQTDPTLLEHMQRLLKSPSHGKSGGFCCQAPPNPA
jgi:hypothetical protein